MYSEILKISVVLTAFFWVSAIGCERTEVKQVASPRESSGVVPDSQDSDSVEDQKVEETKLTSEESGGDREQENVAKESTAVSGEPQSSELPTLKEVEENPKPADYDPYRKDADAQPEKQTIEIPDSWTRLGKEREIWIDMKNKQVIAAGNICMNAGPLEVFACPRRTKEHESIVSVNAFSSEIHAGLLALGTSPGSPVQWRDEYKPATGPVIKIDVKWKEKDKVKSVPAQKLIRNFKTGKTMELDWVFGGSHTYTDEETGETYYFGDSGELVCLSNFSTATMDVPVKSSDANEGLLFEANTPNIPEINTKVYLIFKPQIGEQKKTAETKEPENESNSDNKSDQ